MDRTALTNSLAAAFGEAITYAPPVGDSVSIADAVWDEREAELQSSDQGDRDYHEEGVAIRVAALAVAEINAVITRTATGGSFTVSRPPRKVAAGLEWELFVARTETTRAAVGLAGRRIQ